MLEAAGLSAVEEAVYRSLLRGVPCTTRELSGELRFATGEVEAIVTSLEAKGLVSRTDAEPPTFTSVRPDVAVEALLLHREEELQRTRIAVQQLVSEYTETTPERRLEELVEVAVGREAIELRFEQLQRRAAREVLFCVAPPFVVPLEGNDTELELLEQGIAYRAIYDRSALAMPGAVEQIRRYVLAGEEARALPDVPMKLVVADRSDAMVPARAESATIEAAHVLVHPSTLLDALVTVFEALWAQATPLVVDPSGSLVEVADAPSAEDRILLSLLLAGLTDLAIADQLGLSVRTVQRRLRRLMDLAGVTTRMQLGWHASRSGWLGWAQSDLEPAVPARSAPA